MLKAQDIRTDFVKIKGDIRTNLKVVEEGGILTELNEAGPVIQENELNELIKKTRKLCR